MDKSRSTGVAARIVFALAAACVFGPPGARSFAALITGGGNPAADCYAEFDVTGADGTSNHVTCTDGDPRCDADGQCQGSCTFGVALCIDQGNIAGCIGAPLRKPAKVSGNLVQNPGLTVGCGAVTRIAVKTKKGGRKPGRKKIKVTTISTGTPRRDRDTLFLTCVPRTGACPTTTTTMTTATTTPPSTLLGPSLSFVTGAGTTSCGTAGLAVPAGAPFSGELDSDTAGTTKIGDLGLGCLYVGGGNATTIPPGPIPAGATSIFGISSTSLVASSGTGSFNCTKASGPGKHCINAHCNADADCGGVPGACAGAHCTARTQPAALPCTADLACGGAPGSCALDANCFFGSPLEFFSPPPLGALTTCVINVVASDASGVADPVLGTVSVSLPLSSRVYNTGNTGSPCPRCVSGTCTYGEDAGNACTTGSSGTSQECRPTLSGFQAPLPVMLNPLTTAPSSAIDAAGNFCPGQATAGAVGQATARRIAMNGSPAGDLTDFMPHPAILAYPFCIPATGNPAIDGLADLPGPGAASLPGNLQLH